MKETVYIFHKNGANNHYVAFKNLLDIHNVKLEYHEFSIVGKLLKSITKLNFQLFIRQIQNILFVLFLLFTRNKKIILGIAPYDKKLKRLCWLLQKHQVYYHTSWCCWNKSFQPKKIKSEKILNDWKSFLEQQVKHIFCVTSVTRQQILENYRVDISKTSVVLHSLKPDFLKYEKQNISKEKNSFICIGRLTPEKGIIEVLEYFKKRPYLNITFVGSGPLRQKVKEYTNSYKNITYKGKIRTTLKLKTLLATHQYLILNSKKTTKWEELFGIVIIEAMSQGTIPISSNHPGPKDIIKQSTGILFEEDKLTETLNNIDLENYPYLISENGMKESKKYNSENISKLWKAILN